MVSDLQTFAHKGFKISALKKFLFGQFLPKYQNFWYRCYYPHRSRDSLSPVCGIFDILESIARYTGLLLAPEEVFGLG